MEPTTMPHDSVIMQSKCRTIIA